MKIINLIENTEGSSGCAVEHGLSFYIETAKHKLLVDTGQTDLILRNAESLYVDLKQVDTVVLSHGHYDHCGGMLSISEINSTAKVYLRSDAFTPFYSESRSATPRFIGIDSSIKDLPHLILVDKNQLEIDDELSLFSGIGYRHMSPSTNKKLFKEAEGKLVNDDFSHEQCLVIRENGKYFLFSGCAHHGILNILDRFTAVYGLEPDYVFSGFHTLKRSGYSKEDVAEIEETAKELLNYKTKFFTCHCTGEEPYEIMKKIMGDQINYIHCGDRLSFSP